MVLGGAQFGLDYGITNTAGCVSYRDAEDILLAANSAGVVQIDTARGYGESEAVIGRVLQNRPELRFKVITKLSPMTELQADSVSATVLARVDASLAASMDRLGQRPLDTVMLHRASHFRAWGGVVWARLQALQRRGDIQTLGVSVQDPNELMWALDEDAVSIIQLPFNILDWRWQEAEDRICAAKQSRKLEIHARSTLLQGLLTATDIGIWRRANVENSAPVTEWIREAAEQHAEGDIPRLCIQFVRSQGWIDGAVIGTASLAQLEENITYFSFPAWSTAVVGELGNARPYVSECTLNPALWRIQQ